MRKSIQKVFHRYGELLALLAIGFSTPIAEIVTQRLTCDFQGDVGPEFYGFPWAYRTSIPWVNSMSGNLYLWPLIGNTLIHFIAISLVYYSLKRLASDSSKLMLRKAAFVIAFTSTGWATFSLAWIEWHVEWTNQHIMQYTNPSMPCEAEWVWGSYGN